MAVTDLTDSLPWWARQGGGPTGTPSATPQGGPPAGVSSDQWLNYLQQMFGQSGGQAGPPLPLGGATPLTPAGQPLPPGGSGTGGSSWNPLISSANAAQAPPDPRAAALQAAQAQLAAGGASGAAGPAGAIAPNVPPMDPRAAALQSLQAQLAAGRASGAQGPAGAITPNLPGPPPQPPYNPLAGGSANTGGPPAAAPPQTMPWRGPIAGDSPANIAAAGGGTPAPAGPMAANSRFIGIDRPNAPAEGGPYGRSGLQGTALNLAGMFGGGAPAAAPGPLAASGAGKRPGMFPYGQATTPGGPFMPFDITGNKVAGVNAPMPSTATPAAASASRGLRFDPTATQPHLPINPRAFNPPANDMGENTAPLPVLSPHGGITLPPGYNDPTGAVHFVFPPVPEHVPLDRGAIAQLFPGLTRRG